MVLATCFGLSNHLQANIYYMKGNSICACVPSYNIYRAEDGLINRNMWPDYVLLIIQGVPGGMDNTSGECSLC